MSSSAENNLLAIISNQGLGIRKKAREFSLVSVCMLVYFADEHYAVVSSSPSVFGSWCVFSAMALLMKAMQALSSPPLPCAKAHYAMCGSSNE